MAEEMQCDICNKMGPHRHEQTLADEIRRLRAQLAEAQASERERCAKAIPTSWLDSLLTGPTATLPSGGAEWGCPDIERLLDGIRQRIRALSPNPNQEKPE